MVLISACGAHYHWSHNWGGQDCGDHLGSEHSSTGVRERFPSNYSGERSYM